MGPNKGVFTLLCPSLGKKKVEGEEAARPFKNPERAGQRGRRN